MTIHHSTLKKAAKLGFTLEETDSDKVRAFAPNRGLQVFGSSADDAVKQMQAALVLHEEYRVHAAASVRTVVVTRRDDGLVLNGEHTPVSAHEVIFLKKNPEWIAPDEKQVTDEGLEAADAKIARNDKGVALDGRIAFSEGTPAGDCPYDSETDDDEEYENFERWNEEWDAAADEKSEEDEKEGGGSVVKAKYRTIYAEAGHPTHCGDWLAELLNNLCLTSKNTDIERFTAICEANGVDMSKYDQSNPGWQGRYRMTGRNLLAKKVYLAGGVIKTPIEGAEAEYRAPGDWMAAQRFKMPKAEQAKPIPTAE